MKPVIQKYRNRNSYTNSNIYDYNIKQMWNIFIDLKKKRSNREAEAEEIVRNV